MFNYGCGCGITAGFTVIGLGGQGRPAFCARPRCSHIHSATRICRSLLCANGRRLCRICQKQFRVNAAPSGLIIRQASRGRMSEGMSGRIVLNTPVNLGCMVAVCLVLLFGRLLGIAAQAGCAASRFPASISGLAVKPGAPADLGSLAPPR